MKLNTDATDSLDDPTVENFATERAALFIAPSRLNTSLFKKIPDTAATAISVAIVISDSSGTDKI
jgi:hypothetical protein